MFQFPTFPSIHYFTHLWIHSLFLLCEFPHSDICGWMDICSYPQLFAAYHVLLRLSVPRHSPDALIRLTLAECSSDTTFSFFSSPYLDVSVQAVPDVWLWIHHTTTEVFSARFPHSDISGSMDICSSPKLFAAYHVFHRLLVPRHPPCALYSLTNWFSPAGAGYSSTIHSVVSLVLGSLFKTSYCLVTSFDVTPRMSWYYLLKDFILINSICSFQGTLRKQKYFECVESLLS